MPSDCIFCAIVAGETPADVVAETDELLFFRDISPQAPVHVLGIPRQHIPSTAELEPAHDELVGSLLRYAHYTVAQLGIAEAGYRLIVNTGPDASPEVGHLHVHLLGGEPLGSLR